MEQPTARRQFTPEVMAINTIHIFIIIEVVMVLGAEVIIKVVEVIKVIIW